MMLVLGLLLFAVAVIFAVLAYEDERALRRFREAETRVALLHGSRLAALLDSMPGLPAAAVDALADFHAYRREIGERT